MQIWQKCPVCNGVGRVSGGYFARAGDYNQWAAGSATELCRICGGTGLIKTPKDDEGANNGRD